MIAHRLLVQQFDECRTAHFEAGGKRKGLKYPEGLRRGAATCVRCLPLANYSDVAVEQLGDQIQLTVESLGTQSAFALHLRDRKSVV